MAPPPTVVKTPTTTRPTRTKAQPKKTAPTPRTEAHPAPRPAGNLAAVVAYALAQQGRPYRWGAAGPSAFDCSGLIMAAFLRIGIRLPHQSGGIAARGTYLPRSAWTPGTVLIYPGHVALYLGNGRMVHASRPGRPVAVVNVYGNPSGRGIG